MSGQTGLVTRTAFSPAVFSPSVFSPTVHSPDGARLRRLAGPAQPSSVVLLLHGGDDSDDRHRVPWWWPPVLRTILFAPKLHRTNPDTAIYQLWNSATGWCGGGPPVRDARWALAQLRGQHPDWPIALIGHSMGGRVGVRILTEPDVVGFVGLAPWLPRDEPIPDLTGRQLLLLNGAADRTIPIGDTRRWAERAERAAAPGSVEFTAIPGSRHAMLMHFTHWHRLAADQIHRLVAGPS